MTTLKPGTLCVIVGGCPENIGLVVEVLQHIGPYPPRADAYQIRTVTGRNFPQLKVGPFDRLAPGSSTEAITDRHKLRPLGDDKGDDARRTSSKRLNANEETVTKQEALACAEVANHNRLTVSPFSNHDAEPIDSAKGSYPYIVIRFIAAVYQRENLQVRVGAPEVHIGHRTSFIQYHEPYAEDGAISPSCRAFLLDGVLDAVRRLKFRMCVVWKKGSCTFVEPDGQFRDSDDPPSGGILLPKTIDYDTRLPFEDTD